LEFIPWQSKALSAAVVETLQELQMILLLQHRARHRKHQLKSQLVQPHAAKIWPTKNHSEPRKPAVTLVTAGFSIYNKGFGAEYC
jgi:precorrin-6B methylase 1